MAITKIVPTNDQIGAVLTAVISKEGVPWNEIVAAVENANYNIKNWMKVRNVLQHGINQGRFARAPSTFHEVYFSK